VVGTADVDVGQGVGAVEELAGDAEIRDRLPYEERLRGVGIEGFAPSQDGCHELDAARGTAD